MKDPNLLSLDVGYWLLQSVAMLITALLIPRLRITSIFGAVGIVLSLAFVNAKLWDAALFFELPDSFSLHAGTLLVANGLIFWALVKLLPGIEVHGFLPALAAPVVFAVCSMLIAAYGSDIDWKQVLDFARWFVGEVRGLFRQTAAQLNNAAR